MRTTLLLTALLTFFSSSAWAGCIPISGLAKLPPYARNYLNKAYGPMSDLGGPFNPTDVVPDETPRVRFKGACQEGNRLVVAVELGGIAHAMELTEFLGGQHTRSWPSPDPSKPFTPALAKYPAAL